jgi:TonB-dependent receptor
MLIVPLLTLAETGSINGKVIDAGTGEELIGATIVITGTTTGTITDFDGNFLLNNLAPGQYDISVSYVSYQTQQFKDVVVKEAESTMINVNLEAATTELQEVKVVARSRQKTEAAMQVLQRKSASVLDGISSEQISRLGDADAAGALKRVTGVSVKDGKYIYVRGLGDRYMKVTFNQAEIPGLDPNYNTVHMDLFPSNVIENLVVLKTYTPDKPSFTSGLVNIKTKDFPTSFTLQASAKIGFNTNVHFHDQFIEYEGSQTDWLAFDDGKRSLPGELDEVQIPNPTDETSVEEANYYGRQFNKVLSPNETSAPIDQSYSLSFGDQINLSTRRAIGYIAAVGYKTEHSYYDDGRLDTYYATTPELVSPDELLSEKKGVSSATWNVLLGLNFKLSLNNKIGLTYMRTQNGESTARSMSGHTYFSDDYDMKKYSLEYLYRALSVYQINGIHVLENWNNLKVEWLSSYTNSIQNTPDMRFFINEVVTSDTDTSYFVRSNRKPERRYRDMNETNWDNKIDLIIPATNFMKFKAGASYLERVRNSDENRFTINQRSAIQDYNGNPSDYVRDENFVSGYYDERDRYQIEGIYYSNDFFENSRLSYLGMDRVVSAYVMGDITLFNKLRLIGGVRMEYSKTLIENKVDTLQEDIRESQKEMYLHFSHPADKDFLPSINVKYEIIENMNLRLGYYRSITRPSFRERAPYTFYEYTEGTNIQGNPELERGLVDNIDLRWEYFFRPGEKISLGAFYKKIYSPIERYEVQGNIRLTKFRNGEDAYLTGVEFELRKNLDFIGFLRDFSIGTNLSYIYSEAPVDSQRLADARIIDPEFPDTRPFYGQSPYVINVFLHYDNTDLGLYANAGFNMEGKKIVIISERFTPDVYEQPYPDMNFNIGKTLFDKFTIEFSADNLLNPIFQQNITLRNGDVYPFRQYTEGRKYAISISYSIK